MPRRDDHLKLIEQFIQRIHAELPAPEAAQAARFAQQYLDRFPFDEVQGRASGDLYAALLGSWHFLQRLEPGRAKVRIFNPEFERHGWQTRHTVVAVLTATPPFALNSVRAELNRRNITIFTIHSATLAVVRDEQGVLLDLPGDVTPQTRPEALLFLEINRHTDPAEMADLATTLSDILGEAAVVVRDFEPMRERLRQVGEELRQSFCGEADLRDEIVAFIDWMLADNFTFLGAETLLVGAQAPAADSTELPSVSERPEAKLGLLRERGSFGLADLHADLADARSAGLVVAPIVFSKSSVRSRVHRRVYPDYVCFRRCNEQGELVAETRFLGLFTSRAYAMPAHQIPLVRRKVEAVLGRSGYHPESHEYAELRRVLEVHPRDELFQADADQLFQIATGIQAISERRLVRLFVRRDARRKFVSCLVYMPRDIYRTGLRRRIEELLVDAFDAEEVEFSTFFSESILTRTYFLLRVNPLTPVDYDLHRLERAVAEATLSWQDQLRDHLVEHFGEEQGAALARQYDDAFPAGYRDDWDPRAAVSDIQKILTLRQPTDIALSLYRTLNDAPDALRFRLFHVGAPLPLSDVMPILENLGLRVISERPYEVERRGIDPVWVHEFGLVYPLAESVDPGAVSEAFQEAFARIWYGDAENDSFNKLILGAGLGWRACAMLRAYARYMKQIQFVFSSEYIAETLVRHLDVTCLLAELFAVRFDPARVDDEAEQACAARIMESLERVANLTEDRILRQYVALIKATVRTNFYQPAQQRDGSADAGKSYLSFKFLAEQIPELPLPRPCYEVFVYSPRVEGVHLRTSKVARGGLRWSDRPEDFRTEILGLVKAQQVKNAVIVPSGAKGGFVPRRLPVGGSREQIQEEAIACYRLFIQGLLDLTDNRVDGAVVPPPGIVRKDDEDTYLVVAADKGTASFSDIANGIAADYGFWLGDAFASGGSAGYDHKRMGITARGAWVSVQRHFRELEVDPDRDPITVVGIGDMSGDVFGNGMLRSRSMLLVAAFNHLHIFIDPDPEPAGAWEERRRLFDLPRSSWADYDRTLISDGGGVFERGQKSIAITPQMQARFGIEAKHLAPHELIAALLCAPVDLLWNGGIGTYVKAARQSHADVGDKANDAVRVDGRDLRCRVVGEGGNLGMTQLGRIEYALRGGRCNTDFIDNSGGVDCSDHEVNIKIALNPLVAEGDMTEKQRRALLAEMTDTVAELVLANNYRQALALTLAERQAAARHAEYRRLIHRMEVAGHLDRALEFIPDEEALAERKAAGKALTRPELAVLMAYTKSGLQEVLVASDAPEDPLLANALFEAFPSVLCERYTAALENHRLRREIIATFIANDLVDLMGIAFPERILQSTGATPAEMARAYVTAREIFAVRAYWQAIARLDGRIASGVQMEMLSTLMRLTRRATRWLIRNRRAQLDPGREVERFGEPMTSLFRELSNLLEGRLASEHQAAVAALQAEGVPDELAHFIASANLLYSGLGLIDAAAELGAPLDQVFAVYQRLVLDLDLDLFAQQVAALKAENHWQALARESFRDDLEWQVRRLTIGALRHICSKGDIDSCVARWHEQQQVLVQRWRELMTELNATDTREFAVYAVAIRELLDLAQSSHVNDVESA